MSVTKKHRGKLWGLAGSLCAMVALTHCGNDGNSGNGGGSGNKRHVIGVLKSISSPLKSKAATTGCDQEEIVCADAQGNQQTFQVNADCSYDLEFDKGQSYFCGVFGSNDEYLAEFDCQEGTSSQDALPIFDDADGSDEAIDLGETEIVDRNIDASEICNQVDQDGDGLNDGVDNDDDGDTVNDGDDLFDDSGCERALLLDTNNNDIPDIFETLWGDLSDLDDDSIPNLCDDDVDGDNMINEDDTDDDGDNEPDDTDLDDLDDGFEDSYDFDGNGFPDYEEFASPCLTDNECQALVAEAEIAAAVAATSQCLDSDGLCEVDCADASNQDEEDYCLLVMDFYLADCDNNGLCSFEP